MNYNKAKEAFDAGRELYARRFDVGSRAGHPESGYAVERKGNTLQLVRHEVANRLGGVPRGSNTTVLEEKAG